MQDFAYLRHLTLGQYLPRDSFLHHLDPRTKILGLIAIAAAISTNTSYTANVILILATFALALLAQLSPLYILSGLRPAVPFIVFFAFIQAIFFTGPYGPTTIPRVLIDWGPFTITTAGIRLVLISIFRLVELWLLTSLLTNATPISTLAHGIESLLRPLSGAGFPGHEVALVFTLALRFLPVFGMELEDTIKAQIARGVYWETGRMAFVRNARRVAALLVPLFADALRRAEDLATAMEARCYVGGKGRTHLLALRFRTSDWVSLAVVLLFSVALVATRNVFQW